MRRQPIILALIATTILTSVAARIVPSLIDAWALVPAQVFRGQIWRLGTWTFLELSPLSLLFSCITLYMLGGDLLSAWSQRRFVRFVAAVVVGSAVGACLLALPIDNAIHYPKIGGYALGDAIVVAWALQFPHRTLVIYRLLPLSGDRLAYGMVALTLLFVVFFGLTYFAPELLAGAGTLAYMKRWWLRPRRAFRSK